MKQRHQSILLSGIIFIWLLVIVYLFANNYYRQAFLSLAPIAVVLLALLHGTSKITSLASRIFVFGGILSIISLLVLSTFSFTSATTHFAALIIVTGLVLERISPHTRLQKWMFLAIATKIEAIIIGSLIAIAPTTVTGINWWWLIIPLMVTSVLLLVLKQKFAYRLMVILLSAISIGLFVAISLPVGIFSATALISGLAVVWPAVTQRLIGYRVFVLTKQ